MSKNKWFIFAATFLLLFCFFVTNKSAKSFMRYCFYTKSDLKIAIKLANPSVKSLAADPSNSLILDIRVRDKSGMPVPEAHVKLSVSENIGTLYPSDTRTDLNGKSLVTYTPPSYEYEKYKGNNKEITINSEIVGSNVSANQKIELTRSPVIFIHGYQANSNIFDNMREYFSSKGFEGAAFNYNSQNGVIPAANELSAYLKQEKLYFLSKGIQVNKFDVVAHSLGGLVVRYYTCSYDYVMDDDVRKIIFISTPHKGSHWAALGLSYFNDQGIKDIVPESDLITRVFPSLLNKGLNSSIQVGNILGQYDEVVSTESASLEEWNIKTEIFNVGEKSLTMDNLLSGKIIEAPNHQSILDNKKVFEKIEDMLNINLPYPIVRK